MASKQRFEIVGTEHPMQQSPPVGSPSADPRSGQFQMVGDNLRMSRSSIQSPSANPKSGTWEIVGDGISMSRSAVKGWGNAARLQMSDRANEQSKTAGTGGVRKRR